MNILEKRPTEISAPAVFAIVTGILTAVGVDAKLAASIAGVVGALAPGVVTFLVARAKPYVEVSRNAALQAEKAIDVGQEVLDKIDEFPDSDDGDYV